MPTSQEYTIHINETALDLAMEEDDDDIGIDFDEI